MKNGTVEVEGESEAIVIVVGGMSGLMFAASDGGGRMDGNTVGIIVVFVTGSAIAGIDGND